MKRMWSTLACTLPTGKANHGPSFFSLTLAIRKTSLFFFFVHSYMVQLLCNVFPIHTLRPSPYRTSIWCEGDKNAPAFNSNGFLVEEGFVRSRLSLSLLYPRLARLWREMIGIRAKTWWHHRRPNREGIGYVKMLISCAEVKQKLCSVSKRMRNQRVPPTTALRSPPRASPVGTFIYCDRRKSAFFFHLLA